MGGASTSTSLIPPLVQGVTLPPHILTVISYIVKLKISLYIKLLNVTYDNINSKISAPKAVKLLLERATKLIKQLDFKLSWNYNKQKCY